MEAELGEIERAVAGFGADADRTERAHQAQQRTLMRISQSGQFRYRARTVGQEIGEAELCGHVDDGGPAMSLHQILQNVRRRMRDHHRTPDFGKALFETISPTLARCSSIAAANCAGVPACITTPSGRSREAISGSSAAATTSLAIRSRRAGGR